MVVRLIFPTLFFGYLPTKHLLAICSYIRKRNERCSFREFIDLYQEMIIESPPNTDNWNSMGNKILKKRRRCYI